MRVQHFILRVACFMLLFYTGLIIYGCGGGSHSENIYPLSSQTRLLQPGDSWLYDNHESVTIGTGTFKGQPTLTRIKRYESDLGPGFTVDCFFQNQTQEVIYIGRRGSEGAGQSSDSPDRPERPLITPQTVLFGSWTQGAKLSYKLLYQNEDAVYPSEAATLTILGTERVKTPLGTFDTWKVQSELNGPTAPYQITGTYWYAPQLGTFVRAHEILGGADLEVGSEYDITLKSTNVPLGMPETTP